MSFEIEIGSARDTLITEICDAWEYKHDTNNSLIERVAGDVRERIEWVLRNEVEDPRDFDNDTIHDMMHESLDSALIYTQDIRNWWEEFGEPDVYEFDMPDSISDAISLAVYEAASNKIGTTLEDVLDDFDDDALDAAFIPADDDLA